MPNWKLSRLARLDLIEIADYTVDTWGLEQADRYMDSLEDCFKQLVRVPGMGRPCNQIRPGYRRIEHEKHIIIYRAVPGGVFISRILHQRMLPSLQVFEDS